MILNILQSLKYAQIIFHENCNTRKPTFADLMRPSKFLSAPSFSYVRTYMPLAVFTEHDIKKP
jgi:hypothetical protein